MRRSARACRACDCAKPALIFAFVAIFSPIAKAEVSNQQAAEIVNDLSGLHDIWNQNLANTWQSYLSNISSKTSTLTSEFTQIVRPSINSISNYVYLINQEVQKENTSLTNIVGRVNFWGDALDKDLQSLKTYLYNSSQSLQLIDYNISEGFKGETNLLTRIYYQLTTNVVQNANEMLSQLSNINVWVEEQLYTNSTHYAEVELALSNLEFSANAMSNNVATIDSNVAIMKDSLSSISNIIESIYSEFPTNTWKIGISGNGDNIYNDNGSGTLLEYFYGDLYYGRDELFGGGMSAWDYYSTIYGSDDLTYGLINAILYGGFLNYWNGFTIYNDILPVVSNSWNTITNKTQSIPYTVILPEVSSAQGNPNIFGALTNAYLTSYNQQSDLTWFDRVELLLASLVFQEVSTNGNENSWSLDTSVTTSSIDTSYGQYQTGVQGLQTGITNYKNTALGLLTNIRSKFDGVQNNGIEWQIGGDDDARYFGIDTTNQFFTVLRTISIICWSCAFLFFIVKLFAFISPYVFKGFKLAFNVISALIMR